MKNIHSLRMYHALAHTSYFCFNNIFILFSSSFITCYAVYLKNNYSKNFNSKYIFILHISKLELIYYICSQFYFFILFIFFVGLLILFIFCVGLLILFIFFVGLLILFIFIIFNSSFFFFFYS